MINEDREDFMTKEIRILADTPPSRELIPKYEKPWNICQTFLILPENTTMLDQAE
jgi:hypothetical protein